MSDMESSDPLGLEGHLLITMIKANKILIRHIDRLLRTIGTSIVEVGILHRVRSKEYTRLTDLAEDDFISKSRVSNILNAMVERGLIERVKDSRDERVFELAITEPGEKLYSQSIHLINELSIEFFKGEDLGMVGNLFEIILERIEEISKTKYSPATDY